MRKTKILIADDDKNIQFAFKKAFEQSGHDVISASTGQEAVEKAEKESPSLIFMDITMPGISGLQALERIKGKDLNIPVIIITGFGTMQTAIRAMQLGAYDYLSKPLDVNKLRLTAQRALELVLMRHQIQELQRQLELKKEKPKTELIGNHLLMQEVYKKIGIVSTTPNTTTVLIMGETGTGKELVARAIHESGGNADAPFQAINCTVLPENLLESELFGHEKGAFTGADRHKRGKFALAEEGTLFLDEIGDMPVSLQKKLLRVIQEREFEELGSNKTMKLNARIIAATHQDLKEAINKNLFREDLFYRLNVFEIFLPLLRERKEDIPVLANYFLLKFNDRFGKRIAGISPETLTVLSDYHFPGNVRELKNLIERAVVLEQGNMLTQQSFPQNIFTPAKADSLEVPVISKDYNEAKKALVEAFERKFLVQRLVDSVGNVTRAAEIAGIERQSFQRLMKKYNLSSETFKRR
ncbi:MAG: sigma-54-dependent Fis family transcriptional regulator [Calditrichaeota bacterium]|nr:sigma-54-dependent Fis family transcriptional regulator [Calditrichota bacterium]